MRLTLEQQIENTRRALVTARTTLDYTVTRDQTVRAINEVARLENRMRDLQMRKIFGDQS